MNWSVIMSYNPNFNDPRTQRRIKKAIGFVSACIPDTSPRQWYTRELDKHLGRNDNDLGKWLRSHLITCVNDRYNKDTGECKSYIKNSTGLQLVKELLLSKSITYPSVLQVGVDWAKDEYKDELATKDFTYDDKSGRLWHPLQRVRKEFKFKVFSDSGLKYQYDIECCAPTLIHQHSQKLDDPMDLYLFALRKYISDRKSVRQELAKESEISEDLAKTIINALITGAQLGMNSDSDIYHLLKGDKARIEYLKQNEYIKELRSDMKVCWDYIKQTLPRTTLVDKNGKTRTRPISSKQKSGVYFTLERLVLDSVIDYLKTTNNKYFLEHDGWVCTNEIDRDDLIKWVKVQTGYNINLDRSVL